MLLTTHKKHKHPGHKRLQLSINAELAYRIAPQDQSCPVRFVFMLTKQRQTVKRGFLSADTLSDARHLLILRLMLGTTGLRASPGRNTKRPDLGHSSLN